MRTRHVERTGWDLAEIGFGSWQLGADWGPVSDSDAIATLHAALDGGVDFIDTADVYGDGRSEQLIARALKERGGTRPLVATKLGRRSNPHIAASYTRENMTAFVERSLRNLATDALDLVQLHSPPTEVFYQPDTFEALEGLVRQGKIRRYGASVEKVEEGIKALEYPGLASVQIIFNMFRQRPAGLFFKLAGERAATYRITAATYGDDLFFGLDGFLKKFSKADSLQETRLALPTGYVNISAGIEHEGVLLLALTGAAASGVGTSAIFTYDNLTLVNVLSGINVVKGFGIYNDKACAIFDGTPNSIRVRSGAGVWSAPIVPSAGTVKIVGSNCSSYRNKLYIPNGDSDLFTFDEASALTRIPLATTGVDAGSHISGTAVMDDSTTGIPILYFLWHTALQDHVYVGKYDGTTWTPKLKDITAQVLWPAFMKESPADAHTAQYPPGISKCIRQYRGSLVVAAVQAPAGLAAIYFSPRGDITGTWTRLLMSVSFPNSDVNDMQVF